MTTKLPTNFESDLRRAIFSNLLLGPVGETHRSELEAMATKDLLIVFFNWLDRLVHPHPRILLCSGEFEKSPSYNKHRENIDLLIRKIMLGEPITPHLSRSIRHGWEPGGKSSVRDFDLMLNDWGIHHLHFGQHIDPDGFANRKMPTRFWRLYSGPVLRTSLT